MSARPGSLAISIVSCLAAALLLPAACQPSRPDGPPRHLLLITLDTMRADRLPAYGFTGVKTPTLDRLAADGVVFEEALSPAPLTLPSHATLMTGRNPPAHGVRDNVSPAMAGELETLAKTLRGRGVRTAAFVASAVLAPGRGLEQGFGLYSAGAPTHCGRTFPARRRAAEVVDEALPWLSANQEAPFFIWLHLFDTHRPYDRSDNPNVEYLDPYLEAIAHLDAQIGRVVSALSDRRVLDDTLVVVVGDHGESLGDHGEDGHGMFLYQPALRVPLIVRGPGVKPGRVDGVARLIDVMPTILGLFGAPIPPVDGVSLAKVLTGDSAMPPLDGYAESLYPLRFGWAPVRALRADRYKFIDAPTPELYDLLRDPGEEENLFTRRPTVAAAMRGRLRSFDSNAPVPAAPDERIDKTTRDLIVSLGYVGQAASVPTVSSPSGRPDPKDRIAAFNAITRAHWEQSERARLLCR